MEWQRVTKRDELGGSFGGHDGGQPSNSEHIALCDQVAADRVERGSFHLNRPAGLGDAMRLGLTRYVNHPRPAFGVDVGKVAHESNGAISRSSDAVMSSGLPLLVASSFARSTA